MFPMVPVPTPARSRYLEQRPHGIYSVFKYFIKTSFKTPRGNISIVFTANFVGNICVEFSEGISIELLCFIVNSLKHFRKSF